MSNSLIHILLVDDDKYFRMAIKDLLDGEAIFSDAQNESEAIEKIQNNHFDMALIDMNMDISTSGINVLTKTKQKNIHSIILSSSNEKQIVENAYKIGCDHYLNKLHFKTNLPAYIHKYKLKLFSNNSKDLFTKKYITHNKNLREKVLEICRINLKNKSVLITGDTGVGKSLIGRILHNHTYDQTKPFIHLNCSEIPESLIESELFGHVKGAFTGAQDHKEGKLKLANGGTLFLDEIATMPMIMQKKLLKALDEKSFYPVGSNKLEKTEFTLMTATCEDLFEKIHTKVFRKDLFFRISGINLYIDSLSERAEDIPPLIDFFMEQSSRRFVLTDTAIDKLSRYSWPGNIRELKKVIEYLSLKDKGIIDSDDISLNSAELMSETNKAQGEWLTSEQSEHIEQYGLRDFISKIEQESVKDSLKRNHGKITRVIKELKISSSAFYRIFNDLHLKQ